MLRLEKKKLEIRITKQKQPTNHFSATIAQKRISYEPPIAHKMSPFFKG